MVNFNAAMEGSQVQVSRADPLDLTPVRQKLAAYDPEIEKMEREVKALEVTDESTHERAVAMGGQAHGVVKKIESVRKYYVQDPKDFAKQVDSLAKVYKDKFGAIEQEAKRKISAYQRRLEQERREAERKRLEAEEAERKRREEAQQELDSFCESVKTPEAKAEAEPPPPPAEPEPPKVTRTEHGAAHQRKVWTYAVEDESQLPREYLTVDHKKIGQAVKDGVRNIPGLSIYQENKTVFR
jgi:hypothetical protein